MRCPIKFCYNSKRDKTGLKWYSFPTQNESLKSLWLKACGKSEIGKHMRVCSSHFSENDYEKHTKERKKLTIHAVPKGSALLIFIKYLLCSVWPGLLTWVSFWVSSGLDCSLYRWHLFDYFTFPWIWLDLRILLTNQVEWNVK